MGLGHSPKIVTNGLVMCLDAANTKSYRNYNLATYSQDFQNAVYTKSAGLITATGLLAPDGTMTATTLTDDTDTAYKQFLRTFTIPNDSASYNISIYIKKTTGGTSSRNGFNVFLTGGTGKNYNVRFNSDTGVATGGDSRLVTSESNDYWRLSFTVSNNTTGNTTMDVYYYPATGVYDGSDNVIGIGSQTIWGLQITRGASLLPYKTNITDSADTWYDLSGREKNVVFSGSSYSSNNGGYFSFNGVSDSSSASSVNILNLGAITVNVWYYANALASTALVRSNINGFLLHYRGAGFYLYAKDTTASGYLAWNTPPAASVWNMLTGTWDGSVMKLYTNGIKQATELAFTGGASNILTDITTIQLGYYFNASQPYTNGNISNFQLYNRALTDNEILQNFNALRGRFGI